MNNRTMRLKFSYNPEGQNDSTAQFISFVNVLEGRNVTPVSIPPIVHEYTQGDSSAVALFNFQEYTVGAGTAVFDIKIPQGQTTIHSSNDLSVSIYKQEMGYDALTHEEIPLSNLIPVAINLENFHIRDGNVTNNRWYKYYVYFANQMAPLIQVQKEVKTHWGGWSITELHPLDGSNKKYSFSSNDVWVFNLNVETGEQTQNIVRNEQQTLGQYLRYSQGLQNYLTGNVNCLLGRDVLPTSWVERNGKLINEGGYQEKLPFSASISSNDKVDMLYAWRKLVFSHNPKLLKDRKGQSFIVTINTSSNTPNNNVACQPDTISFTWTQIQSLEGVTIIDLSPMKGGS